jgi:sRNA-binding carbon storage regulator CsrA
MLAQCFALGVQCISIINVIEEYAKYIRCEGKVVFCKENVHMYTGSTLCSVDNAGYIYICVNFHNIIKVISKENKLCTTISVNRPRSVSIYQNELYVVSFNSDLQSDVVNVYSIGKKHRKKQFDKLPLTKSYMVTFIVYV